MKVKYLCFLISIFFRILVEFFFTSWSTEVVFFAFIFTYPFNTFFIYIHLTYGINSHSNLSSLHLFIYKAFILVLFTGKIVHKRQMIFLTQTSFRLI